MSRHRELAREATRRENEASEFKKTYILNIKIFVSKTQLKKFKSINSNNVDLYSRLYNSGHILEHNEEIAQLHMAELEKHDVLYTVSRNYSLYK